MLFYVDRNYTKGKACPQVSKRYNWNIVESGVKHDKPHHPYLKSECDQMLMLPVLQSITTFVVMGTNFTGSDIGIIKYFLKSENSS
jgi:hypothetical protein